MKTLISMKKLLVILILIYISACTEDIFQPSETIIQNKYFLSETEAASIASVLTFNSNGTKNDKISAVNKTVKSIMIVPDNSGIAAFYIINYKEDGFIIISADKRIQPVLAYSEGNNFDVESNKLPSGLIGWLQEATAKVDEVRSKTNNEDETKAIQDLYNICEMQLAISNNSNTGSKCEDSDLGCNDFHNYFGPLINTQWNQWHGFNNLLSEMGCDSYQGRPPSGCVATAIGQIMRYYEYPISYQWASMPLSNQGSNEISKLLRDIGTAVNMDYACYGSTAKTEDSPNAFKNTFGYSSASFGYWENAIVKEEIKAGRPVILAGYNEKNCFLLWCNYEVGHAWVCEGYRTHYYCELGIQSTYYYMNWGWGGSYDGYYNYNSWSPGDNNFKYNKRMIFNIKP